MRKISIFILTYARNHAIILHVQQQYTITSTGRGPGSREKEVYNMKTWSSAYFYGNKISDYGLECGYLDYRTLAKAFDAVLNNEIMSATESAGIGYWEMESGYIDNSEEIELREERIEELSAELLEAVTDEDEEEEQRIQALIDEEEREKDALEAEQEEIDEVFQWYIVDDNGARILEEVGEIVYYNEELDMYLWGVTHFGTSWDYVLTDVKLELDEEE